MVAIVGPTAGKTTMVKLLMRFYDVNSGRICLDGHDIRNFNRGQLREMFGMVLQDTWLFQGTIMEKISVTDGWMQQMRKSSRRQKRRMRIISSGRCRAVIRWS